MSIQQVIGSVTDPQIATNTGNIATNVTDIGTNTSDILTKLDVDLGVNTQTGTTYTLLSTDNGGVVTCNNAAAITVTVPSGLGAGFNCEIVQLGAGQVTVALSGTTLNSADALLSTRVQYSPMSVQAYIADIFLIGGDLA